MFRHKSPRSNVHPTHFPPLPPKRGPISRPRGPLAAVKTPPPARQKVKKVNSPAPPNATKSKRAGHEQAKRLPDVI